MKFRQKTLTAIDLFCGAGGLSLGFQQSGVKVLAGIDSDEEALVTYKNNFPKATAVIADLTEPNQKIFKTFKNVDFLLGGPPCQGFSIAGKRSVDDPRNMLINSYLKIVEWIKPKHVVIENVPNILSRGNKKYAENVTAGLSKMGYHVSIHRLNSADFGVPQNRKRVFFLGLSNNCLIDTLLDRQKIITPITTKESISDLPELNCDLGKEQSVYGIPPLTEYQKVMRSGSKVLHNHTAVDHKEKTKEIISMVPDGGNYKNLPPSLQTTRKVNIAWTRMNSLKPCFTIDAGHNHHFHYKANRVPTVRECARIQSFPDDFVFYGKRTSQYRQVGNAVPPMMARAIARAIIQTA